MYQVKAKNLSSSKLEEGQHGRVIRRKEKKNYSFGGGEQSENTWKDFQ